MTNTKALNATAVDAIVPPATGQSITWDPTLPGFGVLCTSSGSKSYVVTGRVRGVKGANGRDVSRRVVIGRVGGLRDDGAEWTVRLARERAGEILVEMRNGEDPSRRVAAKPSEPTAGGPTLRKAMEAHAARQRKRGRSERTIETFEGEMEKYLAAWLDRPIAELTGERLREVHDEIKRKARDKGGRNPSVPKGAFAANRVLAHVSAAWNTLNRHLAGALGSWNPAKAVDRDRLAPKRERLADLADWHRRVGEMKDPIRDDGLHLALYTGLRHEDVREIRWAHVDLDEGTLSLPDPKGGPSAAFQIPLAKRALAIFKRRQKDNARDLGQADAGFAFPCLTNEGTVSAIRDLRQQRGQGGEKSRWPVEDVHTLRRTFESIAHEVGVSELDQHVLTNHSFGSHNVNATYIAQHMDHLRRCAENIDRAITAAIEGDAGKPKRGRKSKAAADASRGSASVR